MLRAPSSWTSGASHWTVICGSVFAEMDSYSTGTWPHAAGPILWEIDRAIKLDPRIQNVSGKLGLWNVPFDVDCRTCCHML